MDTKIRIEKIGCGRWGGLLRAYVGDKKVGHIKYHITVFDEKNRNGIEIADLCVAQGYDRKIIEKNVYHF